MTRSDRRGHFDPEPKAADKLKNAARPANFGDKNRVDTTAVGNRGIDDEINTRAME